MRKILIKIPLIIWVIILSTISYFVVQQKWLSNFSDEQVRLLSGFLTFIGLIFVAVNIQRQWKNERIKTEYLNQPDFRFRGFSTSELKGSMPELCGNHTQCTDDHWLVIKQTGNLAARNLRVGFFHVDEAEENVKIKTRWIDSERLAKDDEFQYKLPAFSIPFKFFNKTIKNCFVVLIEYGSEYSNIKYKRVYHFCSSPVSNPANNTENDWKGKICFYASNLENAIDTDSITVKQILLNKWLVFIRWSRIKKDYPMKDWLINI